MAVPANLDLVVRKLTDYHRTNIKVVPDDPFAAVPIGPTITYGGSGNITGTFDPIRRAAPIEIRLPTTGVIDLETLTLTADWVGQSTRTYASGVCKIAGPRYAAQLYKSITITAGGTRLSHPQGGNQIGLIHTMMMNAYGSRSKYIGGFSTGFTQGNNASGAIGAAPILANNAPFSAGISGTSPYYATVVVDGLFGPLQGKFARFLDLSLLPQIVISIEVADYMAVFLDPLLTSWGMSNFRINVDTIEFGNHAYHTMLETVLAKGPIEIPFANYVYVEGDPVTTDGDISIEANVQATAISTVMGSARLGCRSDLFYYPPPNNSVIVSNLGCTNVIQGVSATVIETINGRTFPANFTTGYTGMQTTPMYTFLSGASSFAALNNSSGVGTFCAVGNGATGNPAISTFRATSASNTGTRYQVQVGSRTYPNYPADIVDAMHLARCNANINGTCSNQEAISHATTPAGFGQATFVFPIALDHADDTAGLQRRPLISGVDSEGGYVKLRYTVSNVMPDLSASAMAAAGWPGLCPVIFAEVTSKLAIYPERVIQVEY